jgi:GTP-binding protein EngB required for normal cell division
MVEFIESNYFASKKSQGKPSVITFLQSRMVRSHSIIAVAKEMISMSENQKMISVNFSGKQSSGKSEIMRTLAHLFHKYSKVPFNVYWFGKNEILNLEETMKGLKPQNSIIVFDDVAFLKASATTKQLDQVQQVLAVIRHLPNGESVRIVLFKSFQYSRSISPFLRQSDINVISSVDASDKIEELIGKNHLKKIKQLKELRTQGTIYGYFDYKMGGQKKVRYKWESPFVPYLYVTGIGARIIVNPLREKIDPICNQCSGPAEQVKENPNDVKQVIEDFKSKFGDVVGKQAVRIKLIQTGVNAFRPRVVQAVRYIDQLQQKKLISIESLANALDLSETRTSLFPRRQPA